MLQLRRRATIRSVTVLLSLVTAVSGCGTKWEPIAPPWASTLGEGGPDRVRVLTVDGEIEVRNPTIVTDTLRGMQANGNGPVRLPLDSISMIQGREADAKPVFVYVGAGVLVVWTILVFATFGSWE